AGGAAGAVPPEVVAAAGRGPGGAAEPVDRRPCGLGAVSGARRRRVGIGDRILVEGAPSVVVGVTGTGVRMADQEGKVCTVTAAELAAGPRFEIPAAASSGGLGAEIGLGGLPAAAMEEASWGEAHIAGGVYGVRPDAPAGARPRPRYDPERTSLTERERAKAAELSAAGRPVPVSTVKHRRQRWEARGLAGLADRRAARRMRPAGRASERVVDAMRQAIGEATGASSRTAGVGILRAGGMPAGGGRCGPGPMGR